MWFLNHIPIFRVISLRVSHFFVWSERGNTWLTNVSIRWMDLEWEPTMWCNKFMFFIFHWIILFCSWNFWRTISSVSSTLLPALLAKCALSWEGVRLPFILHWLSTADILVVKLLGWVSSEFNMNPPSTSLFTLANLPFLCLYRSPYHDNVHKKN